jgi:hypothetical protein
MTLEELRQKVRRWDSNTANTQIASSYYQMILNELDFHALRDWRVYLPAEHPDNNPSYMERLASWIGNLSNEEDQQLLLEYALQISFFSHEDFIALYRTALNKEVVRWMTEISGIDFQNGQDTFQKRIGEKIHNHTWFCPVTDSMDINEFYKANHIQGIGHRPGFSTIKMLSEDCAEGDDKIASNLIHYMKNPSLDPENPSPPVEYIVLLEDIVGSGSQCITTIEWAVINLKKPTLFIPLIICPEGQKNLSDLALKFNGLLFVRPVIQLNKGDLLGPHRDNNKTWKKCEEMESLIQRCDVQNPFSYDKYGYRNTGSSIVTFANTPDNTIPLVHDRAQSTTWNPLFPRVYRDS